MGQRVGPSERSERHREGAGGLDNINPFSDGTHAVALPAFVIPTNLARGTLLHIQTRRTAFGDVELSNSTTIIVR